MEQNVAVGTWYVIHGGDVNLWFSGRTYTDTTAKIRLKNLIKDMGFLKLSKSNDGKIIPLPLPKPKKLQLRLANA